MAHALEVCTRLVLKCSDGLTIFDAFLYIYRYILNVNAVMSNSSNLYFLSNNLFRVYDVIQAL